jgi:hypothetical protein
LTALCIAILIQASCTSSRTDEIAASVAEYAGSAITVSGLTDGEFTVTPGELAKLECVSASASGQSAKAGTVKGMGPSLGTFLAEYGRAPGEFRLARFIASDGYRVTLREKTLAGGEVILAIAGSAGPLPQSERPMRLIIPGADSSQWVYAVERIEFELKD